MAHLEEHRHVFSFKRVILPLLSAFTFTIGAMIASYRSIYVLDVVIDEPAEHTFVATISLENTRTQVRSGELQKEKNGGQHWAQQSSQDHAPTREVPNYYSPKTAEENTTYWELTPGDEFINCHIHNNPIGAQSTSNKNRDRRTLKDTDKEQYVIHIHGLHHTGTGYLRQTMQQALNAEFAPDENSPVATIHDGTFPYLQGLSSTKKFPSPEDEGQHFQNVFPPFRYRQKLFKEASCSPKDYGKLAYLADECSFDNPQQESVTHLGNVLREEWSPFWNTSATFLIQKTPLLDVRFHEAVKVAPTLHVIIVRHPMTSNAWRSPWMGLLWLDAFTHTFDLLAKNEIEWYAVVTYEALIHYHDQVVEELVEIVRSGMKRCGSKMIVEREGPSRRRLHLHAFNTSNAVMGSLSYLVPKDMSISVWEACLKDKVCKSLLEDLTTDVLPHLGFVNTDWSDVGEISEEPDEDIDQEVDVVGEDLDEASEDSSDDDVTPEGHNGEQFDLILSLDDNLWDVTIPDSGENTEPSSPHLSSNPGLVTVSNEFSHVLFTSESDAIRKSASDKVRSNPASALVTRMKNMLATYRKKYPEAKEISKTPKKTQTQDTARTKSQAPKANEKKYWKLNASTSKDVVSCRIDIKDEATQSASNKPPNQIVINIHGLHHTGTGYLRQTIHDSINSLYPESSSMQDYSLYPYIYSSTGARKTRIPENEGQHLQTIYPSHAFRSKLRLGYDFGMYAYLTDYCVPEDENTGYSQIGQVLHNQWSKYWNTSATFLLQKTPTLDVHFLELTKVMPTLHVLVIRHPMTSNSWGHKYMSVAWLDAWSHTLEVLASGEIEWYAVVTYESLIQYHDVVVKELMEVVRSGMNRYEKGKTDKGDIRRALTEFTEAQQLSNHRRLELHASKSAMEYLKPKTTSISLWKACNVLQSCHKFLEKLSSDILPLLGYVDVTTKAGKNENKLTADPGSKGVTAQFGHVLFSSEPGALAELQKGLLEDGDDLQNVRETLGGIPPTQLISAMKELLNSDISPLKGRRQN